MHFMCTTVHAVEKRVNNPARYGQKRLPFSDPDPYTDPPDPPVFGPRGSRPIIQRYGSGSLYHQEKIVRKTLIPTVF
jgi:hypothetical protein